MATMAGPARVSAERRFYSWMALMMIGLVLIGFGPSFYLRGIVPAFPRPNPSFTPLVLLHGAMFTIWMVVFWAQTWLGWSRRRESQAHKRLMLSAALLMMGPAIGRMPLAPPVLAGFAFTMFLAWLTFVPLMIWDRRTLGRLHWATKLGAGVAAAYYLVAVAALASPVWPAFAAHLPGI
jgi:hypothetical protein